METPDNLPESRAAGGIVWTAVAGSDRRIAVVHRPKHQDWALPKGKPEPGERPEQTALREAMEETGVRLELRAFAGTYRYPLGDRMKVVDMWHMVRVAGDYHAPALPKEIDEMAWLPPVEAIERLTHPVEKEFIARHAGGVG